MATKPKPKTRQMYDKQCNACGSDFSTHKAKASRCDQCITENRPAKPLKTCVGCETCYPDPMGDSYHCPACRVSIDPALIAEQMAEIEQRRRAEERRERVKQRIACQAATLALLERTPKGYRKMNAKTARLPIGILWLEVVGSDGAATALTYNATSGLNEGQYLRLLLSYHRLRCRGYQPSELAKLCPKALLKSAAQESISDLPNVEETDDLEVAFSEGQRLAADAAALGLTDPTDPVHRDRYNRTQ